MIFARRSAPDAPRWYRRNRRADRPRSASATVALGRNELIALVGFAVVALVAVVVVAAAISYSHMYDWAKINHEPEWRARLSPVSVDGAILAASIVMFADARMRNRPDWLAYTIVAVGIGWSVFANVAHDWTHWVAAKLIAGWPPVAMAATVELLLRFARRLRERSDNAVREQERTEHRKVKPTPQTAETPPAKQPPVEQPIIDKAERSAPQALVSGDQITEEMRAAGWAPSDYTNLGGAMFGYLEKVDSEATGADLHRLVAVPYFGATVDTGRGRQIVRRFKETQAAAAARGETESG
ncbi:MAG: DUF2637 domain-containing protein [Saccharothrix sp.]|nr:DUF2637 domain-containing protein [Saccharothrix sp.]